MKKTFIPLLLLLLLLLNACSEPVVATDPSLTRDVTGYVRSIDWYNHNFVLETANGQVLNFKPMCVRQMPVWQGMHAHLHYRWIPWNNGDLETSYTSACYTIDWIEHLPGDAK